MSTAPSCPTDSLMRLLSGRWTSYILWILTDQGPHRFGALRRALPGISSKTLTERLRHLESHGLITRDQSQTIPPEVTYSLAPRGAELRPALDHLRLIAEKWRAEDQI